MRSWRSKPPACAPGGSTCTAGGHARSPAVRAARSRAAGGDRPAGAGGQRARVVSTTGMSYDIRLDDKYGQMNLVDIPAEIAAHEPWFNKTLTTVNDSAVRLGIIEGDFHWHKHDHEDEFFLVLEGKLLLDFEDRETVEL